MGFRANVASEYDAGERAYLDYAATAPFDGRLLHLVAQSSQANAASLHTEGRRAAHQLEDARKRIAAALGAHAPSELTFTSGGTESDNTALFGLAKLAPGGKDTYVVVSAVEHHAVLHAAGALKARGFRVKRVEPDRNGVICAQALEARLEAIERAGGCCSVVAVQAVNNEVGTVQPVRELADVAHAHGAKFVCDAVQALGKIEVLLEESGVDAAAFSGHKIGALKGTGLLYVRRGVRCAPLLHGGGQEAGLRSGTSNVPGACVLAQAIEYAVAEREQVWSHVAALRERVVDAIARIDAAHRLRPTLPPDAPVAPHVLSLLCDGLEGETLVLRLDNAGIAASAGSACSSGSLSPSGVLTSMGIPRDDAFCSLRLSFGPQTTDADIDRLIEALPEVLR